MPYAQLDDRRIFYTDTGEDKPCVVFSHGILMDHTMFEAQADALGDDYRCVCWDERGHGATEYSGPFTYWDSAEDLLGLLDSISVDKAALVGMSQGGFLSLRAALLAPERVAALVLIDSQAGVEDPERRPIYDAMLEQWKAGGLGDDVAEVIASIILGPAAAAEWVAKWKVWPPQSVIDAYAALTGREDIHDRLGEITCPAIVIHGEQDAAISLDLAQRLADGLPNCEELVVIPGAGHASNVSHPDDVNKVLIDFLARHLSPQELT